jgi:hypothetical protein
LKLYTGYASRYEQIRDGCKCHKKAKLRKKDMHKAVTSKRAVEEGEGIWYTGRRKKLENVAVGVLEDDFFVYAHK